METRCLKKNRIPPDMCRVVWLYIVCNTGAPSFLSGTYLSVYECRIGFVFIHLNSNSWKKTQH